MFDHWGHFVLLIFIFISTFSLLLVVVLLAVPVQVIDCKDLSLK